MAASKCKESEKESQWRKSMAVYPSAAAIEVGVSPQVESCNAGHHCTFGVMSLSGGSTTRREHRSSAHAAAAAVVVEGQQERMT